MSKINAYFDRDAKSAIIDSLRTYISNEWDEEIGDLKAEFLLDFLLSQIGPGIYNKALEDSQAYLSSKIEDVIIDMGVMKKD